MLTGRLFQTCRAVYEKQRFSADMRVLVLIVLWTNSLVLSEAERSPARAGRWRDKEEPKYSGVIPLRHLNTKTMILRVILSSTGSQCSSRKYRDAWSRFVVLQMSLAAQLCILCKFLNGRLIWTKKETVTIVETWQDQSTHNKHDKMTCVEVQKPPNTRNITKLEGQAPTKCFNIHWHGHLWVKYNT